MYISQILVLYELGYTFYKDILIYVYTFLRLYWTWISYFRMKDYVLQVFSCSLLYHAYIVLTLGWPWGPFFKRLTCCKHNYLKNKIQHTI